MTSVEPIAISSQKTKTVRRSPASVDADGGAGVEERRRQARAGSPAGARTAPPPNAMIAKIIANSRDSLSTANGTIA